jgi:hypothetical protein
MRGFREGQVGSCSASVALGNMDTANALEDAGSLARAFPRSVRADLGVVLSVVPPSILPTHGTVGVARQNLPVVDGEHLKIPYRIYAPEPAGGVALSPVQGLTLDCLHTRHHDGFVRQRRLRRVVDVSVPWVVPFVVALIGEYVLEIIEDVQAALSGLDQPGSPQRALYGRFVAEKSALHRPHPCTDYELLELLPPGRLYAAELPRVHAHLLFPGRSSGHRRWAVGWLTKRRYFGNEWIGPELGRSLGHERSPVCLRGGGC